MPGWRLPLVGTLALTIALAPVQPVIAAPAALPPAVAKAQAGSAVTKVRRWRHRHRHHHHGRGLAIGLGIGIIGGLLAAEAARSHDRAYYYDDEDPRVLCAEKFRSFEWDTGLYTTYDGDKRLCPYLR